MVATQNSQLTDLAALLGRAERLVVLTGAGCSTESGIPCYRDRAGGWAHRQPMHYQQFVGSELSRKRYWARSMAGWKTVKSAEPNRAHHSLAKLEGGSQSVKLITQNVDGLHQKAGSKKVIDLHGRLDRVRCLNCQATIPRESFQERLEISNPELGFQATSTPDGDAQIEGFDFNSFQLPACTRCDGILKPDVVFFGESVPRTRVDSAMAWLEEAEVLLVVGSSLMVWSGYRFVRAAKQLGIPVAILNLGLTRADSEAEVKVSEPCGEALAKVEAQLQSSRGGRAEVISAQAQPIESGTPE